MGPLARIPIRTRLVLAFVLVMAVVLTATGAFLYLRLADALDDGIDRDLRTRARAWVALAGRPDPALRAPAVLGRGGFAQVLETDGTVAVAVPPTRVPLLTRSELRSALSGELLLEKDGLEGSDETARLVAVPASGGRSVVVVGVSLEGRNEALEGLLTQLLIGVPLALLLSGVAAFGVVTAALRPVEAMRMEADAVSAAEPGRRLPLPPADDEVRRLGITLNTMLERLEAALARERRFVADAGHELRTPLAALRTELELATRRERSPEELRAALRSAAAESERLSALADDLLVLARAHDGRLPLRRERVRTGDLLESVKERFALRAATTGRTVEVGDGQGFELTADRPRVEQALGDLVENALCHGRGRIVLSAVRSPAGIELHVVDHGAGFPPGLIDHAFEAFSRGDPARAGEGSGLGLAIVEMIARAHGGSAHAVNTGAGADVWLLLPEGQDPG